VAKKQKKEPKPRAHAVDNKNTSSSSHSGNVDPAIAQQLELLQQRNAKLEAALAVSQQSLHAVQPANISTSVNNTGAGPGNAGNVGLNSLLSIIPSMSGAGGSGGSLQMMLAANTRVQALDILRATLTGGL
jgi:hypothetical protein